MEMVFSHEIEFDTKSILIGLEREPPLSQVLDIATVNSCKMRLSSISAKLKFQERANCGNKLQMGCHANLMATSLS